MTKKSPYPVTLGVDRLVMLLVFAKIMKGKRLAKERAREREGARERERMRERESSS